MLLRSGLSGLYHVSDELADEIARELRYRALLRMALQRKAYESWDETGGVSCHGILHGRIGDKSCYSSRRCNFMTYNDVEQMLRFKHENNVMSSRLHIFAMKY